MKHLITLSATIQGEAQECIAFDPSSNALLIENTLEWIHLEDVEIKHKEELCEKLPVFVKKGLSILIPRPCIGVTALHYFYKVEGDFLQKKQKVLELFEALEIYYLPQTIQDCLFEDFLYFLKKAPTKSLFSDILVISDTKPSVWNPT